MCLASEGSLCKALFQSSLPDMNSAFEVKFLLRNWQRIQRRLSSVRLIGHLWDGGQPMIFKDCISYGHPVELLPLTTCHFLCFPTWNPSFLCKSWFGVPFLLPFGTTWCLDLVAVLPALVPFYGTRNCTVKINPIFLYKGHFYMQILVLRSVCH